MSEEIVNKKEYIESINALERSISCFLQNVFILVEKEQGNTLKLFKRELLQFGEPASNFWDNLQTILKLLIEFKVITKKDIVGYEKTWVGRHFNEIEGDKSE